MLVSNHAIEQFRSKTLNETEMGFSEEKIRETILNWWKIGTVQEPDQYNWAHKFKTYGLEIVEHRRTNGWILTMKNDVIITVHYKTIAERRRDKRRKKK